MKGLELLPNEYFDQAEIQLDETSQEVIDAKFSAIIESLDDENEQHEALVNTPFLNKAEAPGDYLGMRTA